VDLHKPVGRGLGITIAGLADASTGGQSITDEYIYTKKERKEE